MSIGWQQMQQMKRVEEYANNLGFKLMLARYHDAENSYIALVPKDDNSLPIYSRDAELFVGTIDGIHNFLRGIEWARDYDKMIKVSTPAARERKEQNVRNVRLAKTIKES